MNEWDSDSEKKYPVGTVLTAGTATWTKDAKGWWWEHPQYPHRRSLQSDSSVSRLIDQGRIWPKEDNSDTGQRVGVRSDRHTDDAASLADNRADLVEVEDDDPAFADLPSGTAALIAENQGLRASVAKYKRKAALANSRADEKEKQARELAVRVNRLELELKLMSLVQKLSTALEIARGD